MPNTPGATLVSSFLEPLGGGDKYLLEDIWFKGGLRPVPTFASLTDGTTIIPATRKLNSHALVVADESQPGSPAQLYKLSADLVTWTPVNLSTTPVSYSFANVAGLAAVDASGLRAGQQAFVASLDRWFKWSPGALPAGAVVGPTTVFADVSTSGFWIWVPIPSVTWQSQASWTVDPASGNDEANGHPGSPVRTMAEIDRRTSGEFYQSTTITILSDLPGADRPMWLFQSADPALSFITLTLQGQVNVDSTQIVSSYTPGAGPLANTIAFVGAGPPLGTSYQKVICLVGAGPAVRCVGYLTGGGLLSYLTGEWVVPTSGVLDNPQPGDTVQFVDPVQINRTCSHAQNTQVIYSNVKVRPLVGLENVNDDIFQGCEITGTPFGSGGNLLGCITTSTIDGGLFKVNLGYWAFAGCTFFNCLLEVTGATVETHDTAFFGSGAAGGGYAVYGGNSLLDISGRLSIFGAHLGSANTPGGMFAGQGATVQFFSGATIFGAGNDVGLAVDSGANVQADFGVVPTITGTTELSIGGKTSLPPLVSGVPTLPAQACTTWAQLTANFSTDGVYAALDLTTGARFSTPSF
jgi:hypothetical protein